jgi:tetratricopeptide (TPR) repeat protein
MDIQAFHRRTAEELVGQYAPSEHPPESWREILAWHWEQAGAYGEAIDAALEVAEMRVAELSFMEARRWAEHVLALLDRLDQLERRAYETRAYALTIAVLEFGGQYREALGYARLLLRLAEERGNVEARGRSYLFIGRMQREIGKLAAAESELLRALHLAERHQMRELEVESRFHLAKVRQLQGHHLEAFQQLELAQDMSQDNRARLARVCTGIGDVYRVLGAGREAMGLYHRALKLEIGSSNRIGQAMLYEKLGLSHIELGQIGEALQCAQEALRLRDNLNDRVGQVRSHTILGTIQSRLENHAQALYHFERVRELEQGLQNQRGLVMALTNIGDAAQALADSDRARASYLEALSLARSVNDQIGLARTHERLGNLSASVGESETAVAHWNEALRIREALGHSEEAITLRNRIAQSGRSRSTKST